MKKTITFPKGSKNIIKSVLVTLAPALLGVSSDVLAQNTFPANGNVGIGTVSPGYPLDVQGSNFYIARFGNKGGGADGSALVDFQNSAGTFWRMGIGGTGNGFGINAGQFYLERGGAGALLTVNTNGNVGIGTITPSYKLHLNSPDIRAFQIDGANTSWTGMYINNTSTTGKPFYGYLSNNSANVAYHYLTATGDWRLYVAGDRLVVTKGGNVGIGTNAPSALYKLSVNGSIRAKEVVVESGWADFVFEKGYKLKSLEEVASFIELNKHLPDVPSAEEVACEGVKVGEIESTLLQKIEELTLYAIEAKKQMDLLKAKVSTLEAEIAK